MEKVGQKEQITQLEELLQKCTRFLPWTEIAKLIYEKGFCRPLYTAHEIYNRLCNVECNVNSSALDYAYKLEAEWAKIFEDYSKEPTVWIEKEPTVWIEDDGKLKNIGK